MKRQFRCYTKKQHRKTNDNASRLLSKYKSNAENLVQYEKLTHMDIQSITRNMLHNPKTFEQNMGVISSIKGKMYCLKLGEVSSSKDFEHYFFSKQFRMRQQKTEPLSKLSSNSFSSQIRSRIL